MKYCRVCDSLIEPFMSFGKMPVANAFIDKKDFNNEYFFDLSPASCSNCSTFQIVDVPEQGKMFHDHYAYFASTSESMTNHFKNLAHEILKKHVKSDDPFIVEIGSNDGISLQNYSELGIKHLGIDPSKNVVDVCRDKGISVKCDFFTKQSAEEIIAHNGKSDIIVSTNTMHHIPDIKEVVEGAKILLKKEGLMITEDPYLGDMISLNSFEQIYAEHNFIWSVSSMKYLFNLYDMEIIDVIPNKYHGGCLRYYIAHKGVYSPNESVSLYLNKEKNSGLTSKKVYENFRRSCIEAKTNILELIDKIKDSKKSLVGYGATAKSSTLINYCGLTNQHIDYICDSTPAKQGLYSPGAHIPIVQPEKFTENYPDYSILFAWNHKQEILKKEINYQNRGGKWIEYIPKVIIT